MQDSNGNVTLKLDDISLAFGGVQALDSVSIEIPEESLFSIIGPNGAGKTCALNCVNGFYRPQRGEVYFQGQPLTKMRPDKIAQLYTGLTVVDNLMAARHFLFKSSWAEGAIYFGRSHREEVQNRRVVEEIIDFLELERWRKSVVGMLPYGVRKRIDLGRALAQDPKLLLLDEPMAGMNVEEKEDMARFILDVQEEKGITIVLIEHDMGVVMDITDRMAVLDFGRKIAEGTPEEIRANPAVIAAYLGKDAAGTLVGR